jgi:glycosyltransferase involved in cell wall biosynthesis
MGAMIAPKLGTVLILTHHDVPTDSGGDIVRTKKVAQLLSNRWSVRLAGFAGYSPELHPLKLLLLLPFWTISTAWVILSDRFDWVYVYNDPGLVLLCRFLKKLGFRKYRIAYECVVTWKLLGHKGLRLGGREALQRWALACSDSIVVASEDGLRLLADFQNKLVLVPSFVDTEAFQLDEQRRAETRARYGFGLDDKVVGLVGPFDNMYNRSFLTFLREKASRFERRVKFLVVGKCSPRDAFDGENIVWAGHVQDYVAHLAALDCLLVPRTIPTEGAMNKALEAMAMGLPVFTTPVGHSNLEHTVPDEHLFVFPQKELASAMNRILFDTDLMVGVGQRARLLVERLYSPKAVEQKLLQALERPPRPDA